MPSSRVESPTIDLPTRAILPPWRRIGRSDTTSKFREMETLEKVPEESDLDQKEEKETKRPRRKKPERMPGEISERAQLSMPRGEQEQVPNITVQQTAAMYPNFMGDCRYFDMDNIEVRFPTQ
jgi:hypothetical protein